MISEEYYLVMNMLFKPQEKTIIDEKDGMDNLVDINSIEGKKAIFQREVEEWLLMPMKTLLDGDIEEFGNIYKNKPFTNAIFVLFGLFAYIEKMELYRGNGTPNDRQSTKRLVDGVKRIFNNLSRYPDDGIKDILKRSRHNLMHQAMIGDDILLNYGFGHNDFKHAMDIIGIGTDQEVRINPKKMYDDIYDDFTVYLNLIDTDEDIKDKFIIFFDTVYEIEVGLITN